MVHIRGYCNNCHFYKSRPVCGRQRLQTGDGHRLIVYSIDTRRRLRHGGRLGRSGRLVGSDGRRTHHVSSPMGVDQPVDITEYHAYFIGAEKQKGYDLSGVKVSRSRRHPPFLLRQLRNGTIEKRIDHSRS